MCVLRACCRYTRRIITTTTTTTRGRLKAIFIPSRPQKQGERIWKKEREREREREMKNFFRESLVTLFGGGGGGGSHGSRTPSSSSSSVTSKSFSMMSNMNTSAAQKFLDDAKRHIQLFYEETDAKTIRNVALSLTFIYLLQMYAYSTTRAVRNPTTFPKRRYFLETCAYFLFAFPLATLQAVWVLFWIVFWQLLGKPLWKPDVSAPV